MTRRRKKFDWSGPGDLERYGLLALAATLLLCLAWLAQSMLGEEPPFARHARLGDPAAIEAALLPAALADERSADLADADVADAERGEPRTDAPGGGFSVPEQIVHAVGVTAPGLAPPAFDFFEPPVRLPGRAAIVAPPPPGARRAAREVVVGRGDTLQKIAARELGDAAQWRKLLDWNPGLDPKRLRPGMKLALPAPVAAAPSAPAAEAGRFHRVTEGETLRTIAARYYGDSRRFMELLEANRDLLAKPEELRAGMRIRVP